VQALLAQAHQEIGQGHPQEALAYTLEAVRRRRGDAAILQVLNEAKEQYALQETTAASLSSSSSSSASSTVAASTASRSTAASPPVPAFQGASSALHMDLAALSLHKRDGGSAVVPKTAAKHGGRNDGSKLSSKTDSGKHSTQTQPNNASSNSSNKSSSKSTVEGVAAAVAQAMAYSSSSSTKTDPDAGKAAASGLSILEESGNGQIISDAYNDGSSVICTRCNGVIARVRMRAHAQMWCPALREDERVYDFDDD